MTKNKIKALSKYLFEPNNSNLKSIKTKEFCSINKS